MKYAEVITASCAANSAEQTIDTMNQGRSHICERGAAEEVGGRGGGRRKFLSESF